MEGPVILKMISDWLDGDEAAFESVFFHYHPKLLRFCRQFLDDQHLAEDLVMNVLLNVWKQRKKINHHSTFNAYLYRAMRNEVISSLRKQRLVTRPLEGAQAEPAETPSYEYKEILARYSACLEKLPPRRKEIFLLSRERGFTYEQIAHEMNISIHTVRNQITSAISLLRNELSEYSADFPDSALVIFLLIGLAILT